MARLRNKPVRRKAPANREKRGRANRPIAGRAHAESSSPLIVGVGASAGGIEAVGQLLQNVPPNAGMSFVVVQHLDPDHASMLTEILGRRSQMPVVTIDADNQKVERNRVYVLPPNRSVVIADGRLKLGARKRNDGPPAPINEFFSSLAAHERNAAVGVLLSGTGTDGTLGMKQIKAEAGITFAQDDRSASSHGMPASAIAAGVVDFVLPPAGIARELVRIADHPQLRKLQKVRPEEALQATDGDLNRIFALLRALNGVDFSYYKLTTLKRRIRRRMVLMRISSLPEYVTHLQQNPAEVDALFHDLLINVTEFFRDPESYSTLKSKIFPRILRESAGKAPMRVWVPGCSTGEEVYSLAIALTEFCRKESPRKTIQIFGTDISDVVLARARAGIYPPSICREVSAERLRRFFRKVEGGYQISKLIRDCCVFARQNLIEDPPFSKLDLITCRNVLIYLGPVLQKKIVPIFHYALNKNGFLMLGGSETVGNFAELFKVVDNKNKIYMKRGGHPRREMNTAPMPPPEAPQKRVPLESDAQGELHRHVDRILLSHYAPSGVLVNSNLEVLQFRGPTGDYLEHLPGEASLSLVKMVKHGLVVELRILLSRAAKLDHLIRREGIALTQHGRHRRVNIDVIPFRARPSSERYYLVLFEDAPVPALKSTAGGTVPRTRQAQSELVQLREELSSTKRSMQSIIEEQEATNEELKSANEETQSSNEELQSTNEELETAKEELQSTNEELTTLNEELHIRNAELNQVNNDLGNLLSSVSMPILMLGNDLGIRRFTPLAERFFNLIPSDVGRRITDINPNIIIPDLEGMVNEVIETLRTHEREVRDREGCWYSLRVRPYRTTDNKIDGAVIVLVDIDDIKRALEELGSVSSQPLLTLTGDLHVTRANEAFYNHFGASVAETEGRMVYDLGNGAWNIPALRTMLEGILPEKRRVDHFMVEQEFPGIGRRKLSLNARQVQRLSKGTQVIVVAIDDQTDSK